MKAAQARSEIIREVNDQIRSTLSRCRLHFAREVWTLPAPEFRAVLRKIRLFDSFTRVTDPKGEHSFGIFDHQGAKFCFRIDCEDESGEAEEADPRDLETNPRVLTIMKFKGFDPRPL